MDESCEFDPQELSVRLDVTLPGRVEAIGPIVEQAMSIVRGFGCAVGKEFEVTTALHEALANAVVHGCRKDPAKKVRVCIACDEQRGLLIVVRDPGGGFDPADIPSPIVGERLYAEHGRGIYLINQLMDEVTFARGGTEIRMRKR